MDEDLLTPIPKINPWNVNTYIKDYLDKHPDLIDGLFLSDGVFYG